jgi:hypothetical protein
VQALPWFLSESTGDAAAVAARRLALLRRDPAPAPDADGGLVIDATGDRKWGTKTAHIGRQYLGRIGKGDGGVVTVRSLGADDRVSWPPAVEPFTPKQHVARGMSDPASRTKPQLARALLQQAVADGIPLRAVVADSCYGENEGVTTGRAQLGVGSVRALRPSHSGWAVAGPITARADAAPAAAWDGPEAAGAWPAVARAFRDGQTDTWWALVIGVGPYGPERRPRAVVATTDPASLPEHTTWYRRTNLPAPHTTRAQAAAARPAADLAAVVRLSGRRPWVEQSAKQVKRALGWSA